MTATRRDSQSAAFTRSSGTAQSEELYYSCGCIWRGNIRVRACSAHTRHR